jgi:AbrB family looped-hinge helix DNA binding protein
MTNVLTTKMSSRGQVVIPEAMRNQFGWGLGTSFIVEVYRGNVIMQPIRATPESEFARKFDALLAKSQASARAAGLRPKDVADVISDYRASRRRARNRAASK